MQNPADSPSNGFISNRLTPIQQVQLQLGLNALRQNDLNLAIRCNNGAQIEQVADWLLPMLAHRCPQMKTHVCGAHEGHRLIEAFNAALSPQSLDQAHQVQAATAAQPQLWLVREDSFERPADLALVARLLQSFPGTPVRVIFLLGAATGLPTNHGDSRLHTINLDDRKAPNTSDPAHANPVASLPRHASSEPAAPGPLPYPPDLLDVVPAEGQQPINPPPATPSASPYRLPIGVALATALIGGLTWWSQQASAPQPGATGAIAVQTAERGPGEASAPASAESVKPGAASEPSAQTAAAVASAAASTPGTAEVAAPVQARHSATPLPPKVASAHRWLGQLPADVLLIEHSRHARYEQAQRSTTGKAHLQEARIVAVQEGDGLRYLVVTGPFRSADRAANYARRLQLNPLRTHKAGGLRGQLAKG